MSKSTDQNSKPTKRTDFWAFVKNGSIRTVSVIPPLVACLLGIIWVITKEKFFPAVPEIYNYAVLSVALILTGFVGIIYIYRREMPGPVSSVTIKGGCAVVAGIALVLFFWLLGIVGLVFALNE